MSRLRTLDDIAFEGRRVVLRLDLNLPVDEGRVTDLTRIDRSLPTLWRLAEEGARVAILSHFGRPKGKRNQDYSLRPVLPALAQRLDQSIGFAADCIGEGAARTMAALKPGQFALFENVRFHPGEEANDPEFAKALAAVGDVYVNDAFSAAHRAHASTAGIAACLPSAAGLSMQAEIEALTRGLSQPERPVMAIVGGSKISTKLDLLHNLVSRVDVLVLGGGMANTFLAARGYDLGRSLLEADMAEEARAIEGKAQEAGCAILLPEDLVVADALASDVDTKTVAVDAVPGDAMALDLGPASVKAIATRIDDCQTLVWNGPLGAFEVPPFDAATVAIAKHVAVRTRARKLVSVAGGGDTAAALANAKATRELTYLSTAGGAFLEWLEGRTLPGVDALMDG